MYTSVYLTCVATAMFSLVRWIYSSKCFHQIFVNVILMRIQSCARLPVATFCSGFRNKKLRPTTVQKFIARVFVLHITTCIIYTMRNIIPLKEHYSRVEKVFARINLLQTQQQEEMVYSGTKIRHVVKQLRAPQRDTLAP